MGAILSAITSFFTATAAVAATAAGVHTLTGGEFGGGAAGGLPMPAVSDTAKADEEARKEEIKRRRLQTKTLLTGAAGALGEATTGKKILLGA